AAVPGIDRAVSGSRVERVVERTRRADRRRRRRRHARRIATSQLRGRSPDSRGCRSTEPWRLPVRLHSGGEPWPDPPARIHSLTVAGAVPEWSGCCAPDVTGFPFQPAGRTPPGHLEARAVYAIGAGRGRGSPGGVGRALGPRVGGQNGGAYRPGRWLVARRRQAGDRSFRRAHQLGPAGIGYFLPLAVLQGASDRVQQVEGGFEARALEP